MTSDTLPPLCIVSFTECYMGWFSEHNILISLEHCNTSEQRTRDGQYLARKCCGPWNSHSFGGGEHTITRDNDNIWQLCGDDCQQGSSLKVLSLFSSLKLCHSRLSSLSLPDNCFHGSHLDLSCVGSKSSPHLRPCPPHSIMAGQITTRPTSDWSPIFSTLWCPAGWGNTSEAI